MRLGTRIKELRIKEGLTQVQLSEKTGLTERTIQRIENHEVEPSNHSLKKIGEVLNQNLNEQKLITMKKKQRILNLTLLGISVLIIIEFILGILSWKEHWWVLLCWFFPLLGGISITYYRKKHTGS
jgi:transcriptional regulator with XRE-family HTH domain